MTETSPEIVAHQILPARKNLLSRMVDFVFGFDFFVSYAWSDGAIYAAKLAERLTADGFEVFLDRHSYASGDDWRKVGSWTLRRTGQLILVASPDALGSPPFCLRLRSSARHSVASFRLISTAVQLGKKQIIACAVSARRIIAR